MKALFIGGTGIISSACTRLALRRGVDLTLLNRGRHDNPAGAAEIITDVSDLQAVEAAMGDSTWDAVVDFIAFQPGEVRQRLDFLRGRVGQYVFISSASAYQKPLTNYLVTESTPLANPFWQYSRDKIACEELLLHELRERNFPATIVRPSFTYSETVIPLSLNSWERPYTVVDRMRRGKPVVIPGDGTSLWQLTHNDDFAIGLLGLLGHQASIGHAFHITTDEVLSWNQIYEATARAAGVEKLDSVHIASDFIAECLPEARCGLHGDKSHSVVLDNAKIKRFVPEFVATHRFSDGIQRSIDWYDADPVRRQVDDDFNAQQDQLIEAYRNGLEQTRRTLQAE